MPPRRRRAPPTHGVAPRRCSYALGSFRLDRFDLGEVLAHVPLGKLDVVIGLKVQPELRRGAEGLRQAQGGVGGYTGFLVRQPFNARPRNAASFRQRAAPEINPAARSEVDLASTPSPTLFAFCELRRLLRNTKLAYDGCGKTTRRANHFGFTEFVSSPGIKNISLLRKIKSEYILGHPVLLRRASAVVTDVGRVAMDAEVTETTVAASVRRRRVVLAPRCWRQVREMPKASRGRWWQKSPFTRESTL